MVSIHTRFGTPVTLLGHDTDWPESPWLWAVDDLHRRGRWVSVVDLRAPGGAVEIFAAADLLPAVEYGREESGCKSA